MHQTACRILPLLAHKPHVSLELAKCRQTVKSLRRRAVKDYWRRKARIFLWGLVAPLWSPNRETDAIFGRESPVKTANSESAKLVRLAPFLSMPMVTLAGWDFHPNLWFGRCREQCRRCRGTQPNTQSP